jgi:hypothetical protein
MKIFKNGVLFASKSDGAEPRRVHRVNQYIGQSNNKAHGDENFAGVMQQVAIANGYLYDHSGGVPSSLSFASLRFNTQERFY